MKISYLRTFAACGLIIAASQGLAVRAQAEDATADYVAPLDMTSTYAGFIEYPEFLPDALIQRAMAARETTGVNSALPASRWQEATVSRQESKADADFPDDIYKFAP